MDSTEPSNISNTNIYASIQVKLYCTFILYIIIERKLNNSVSLSVVKYYGFSKTNSILSFFVDVKINSFNHSLCNN